MEVAWKSNCKSPFRYGTETPCNPLYCTFPLLGGGGVLFRTAHFHSCCCFMHADLSFQSYLTVLQLHGLSPSCLFPKPRCSSAVSMTVPSEWPNGHFSSAWSRDGLCGSNLQLMHPRILAGKMDSLCKKCGVLHKSEMYTVVSFLLSMGITQIKFCVALQKLKLWSFLLSDTSVVVR